MNGRRASSRARAPRKSRDGAAPIRARNLRSADGVELHASAFAAEDAACGLLLVHGLQSHARWFEASGTPLDLARSRIASLAYDRRGSGRSGGWRGHVDASRDFLLDLDAATDALRADLAPRAPLHALANCFGARALLAYAAEHPDVFRSLVLTAPATHMRRRASYGLGTKLRIALASSHTAFHTPLHDEDFVRDGPWLEWIRRDPHGLRSVTAGFLRASLRLERRIQRAIRELELPLLLVLSRRDVLVDPAAVRSTFVEHYRGPLHVLEYDCDHYVDFSTSRAALVRAIETWLARWS